MSHPFSRRCGGVAAACLFLFSAGLVQAQERVAAPAPPAAALDLAAYRTVETAIRADVRPPAARSVPGYLGVHFQADARNRPMVGELAAGSPAETAGLQVGDTVLKVADREFRSVDDLKEWLRGRSPGERLELTVQRAKKKKLKLTATLTAVTRPRSAQRPMMGVLTSETESGEGAAIRQVTPNSPAAEAGLRSGDRILKVDGASLNAGSALSDVLGEKQPGDTVTLSVKREGQDLEMKVKLSAAPEDPATQRDLPLFRKSVYRLAVIPIEYPDAKPNATITAKEWADALFSQGTYVNRSSITGQPVYGSLNDYYQEQSCGKLKVEGKVFDWVPVSKNRAEYSQGSGTGSRGPLFNEVLDALLARDANALVGFDGIFFLYAGDRFRTTRGGIYWPHRATVRHRSQSWPYFIVPEGGSRMTDISVICHEFGHMLGLPDLYARPENPGSEGLGTWCAMSNQAGNGRPQHMSAWCKEQLGWLAPVVIDPTVKQKLVLAPIEKSSKECFKVLVRPDGSEYLLLENRRKVGFDASLPAEGLLIWRVVVRRPILEESHGVEGPSGPRMYLSAVPYPSSANDAYTPYTTPSSRSQLGGGLPVHITNIRQLPDGKVAFYVGYEFD